MNWYEMYTQGREAHAERVLEAHQQRLIVRKPASAQSVPLRSRIGQALISVGHWVDGRSDAGARYDVERKGAG